MFEGTQLPWPVRGETGVWGRHFWGVSLNNLKGRSGFQLWTHVIDLRATAAVLGLLRLLPGNRHRSPGEMPARKPRGEALGFHGIGAASAGATVPMAWGGAGFPRTRQPDGPTAGGRGGGGRVLRNQPGGTGAWMMVRSVGGGTPGHTEAEVAWAAVLPSAVSSLPSTSGAFPSLVLGFL